MANVLARSKQLTLLSLLVEGNSVRSCERLTGVHRDTILRLMVKVGEGCANLLDETMRDLPCKRLELDELWAFVGKKQKRLKETDDSTRVGDMWTFTAFDPETKLVPCFLTGKRDGETTNVFVRDLAERLRYRVQVTTDGFRSYVSAINDAFSPRGVDYATLVKEYEADPVGPGRYSPPRVTAIEKTPIFGSPVEDLICTSYVERQNLTIRMGLRRFTRLTNGHSKKLENHGAAIALFLAHYNFVRFHSSIRSTPAMAAGVASTMWTMDELLDAAMARVDA